MNLKEGQIINAPFLNGNAKVKKFEEKKGYYLLEAVLIPNNEFKALRISEEQLKSIEPVTKEITSTEDSEGFFFFIEANRIRLAHQFDPLLAINVSQVDPLPHQIEAVYKYTLRDPKVRFLIADDAGAGKTIMAGLVIKELQYRKMAKKILIVAPGHLKYQWQREMKEKFNTHFAILSRDFMDVSFWGKDVWEEQERCIASVDFLKQDDILQRLKTSQWDLIVVDEAHKMSAYGYETKNGKKIEKTQRYKVGEVLSSNSNHMLFLTATPHRGDDENFRLFLDLLRPGFFSKKELLKESVEKEENPVFVRRLKEHMKRFDGRTIFPPRHVSTVKFNLTEDEQDLYYSVTRYVQNYFDRAKENRNIAFAMMILQRRLTSSIEAILKSLERRKDRLEGLLKLPELIEQDREYEDIKTLTEEDLEAMEEKERWKIEEKLEHLTIAKNLGEVEKEIDAVSELIEKAKVVKEQEIESKLVKLRDQVLSSLGDRRLLIFTEFRDTLSYLEKKLKEWGYSVTTIHGNMRLQERIDAEKEFKDESQIMVATEAAGEGINLQFCSIMVNYDIPWNPNRLEQRMGRVHRYGQDKEVLIYNMVSEDTLEGHILSRLFNKLNLMREELGSDRVFDIIGEVIPGTSLDELLKDAIFEQRRMDEITEFVEEIDKDKLQQTLDRIFMMGLATKHIDYSGMLKEYRMAEENRLMPEYIEDYFLRAFRELGGKCKKVGDYYRVDSVPFELRKFNDDYSFKTEYGKVYKNYGKVTFDKQIAKDRPDYEYIAPGHALLEAVNQKILGEHLKKSNAVAIFGDETNEKEGVLWFIEGEITDGAGEIAGKRVFCVYQDKKGEIRNINPSVLWDLKPLNNVEVEDDLLNLANDKEEVEEHAVTEILFPYRNEIAEKRERDASIKKKYGLKSIEYLLQETNDRILGFQERQESGADMSMPILNEERRMEDLQRKRDNLLKEIELEQNLTVSEPRVLGSAVVLPVEKFKEELKDTEVPADHGDTMKSDPEIEKVGMDVAIRFEQENGWRPEDVSDEDLGFDIRSIKYGEDGTLEDIRYIEVKARAREGAVRISSNEWRKAKRFGDKYWLYVVTDAGSNQPKLRKRINNPAEKFRIDEDIYATGYIIPSDRLKEVGM